MQNKLHTIQFSHHPMTNLQLVPQQRSGSLELADSVHFTKLPKKTKFPEKFKLPDKRGFELREMRKKRRIPAARPAPIYRLSMMSMARSISIGQLGCLSGCAPAHLLISWTWQTGERPWFLRL